nr:B-cell receptor CD22-like [Oncorhynchus nerka]XP_029509307.1 B-cell receptor CD22-like [Oncorhynchus nerka]XP_029509308.1 B-cell receptor CD22-like [Oncorhynchus nerka]
MSLRTAGSVLVVFLWSVTVVLGQDGWSVTYTTQSICALKGSTVELTCSYTNPSGLQVKVTPATVTEGQKVTLTCSTTCTLSDNPNATYIWYKNGHVTNQSNSLFLNPVSSEDAGRYSCSVEGHEDLPSDEETLTVTYGPKNTSVSVSPSGGIVEGSSVTLTCSSDANPPVDKYTWYKKNVTSPKATGHSYNISNIISEDRGEYYCEAQNTISSNNSTALMIIVAGKQTLVLTAAVGIIVVVLVVILCLSGLMWFRKKASKSPSDTRDTADDGQGDSIPVYDNVSSLAMRPTDKQDDIHYASVHFSRSKNQEVPLYSTVQLSQTQKQEEDVQYAAVQFNRPSAAT